MDLKKYSENCFNDCVIIYDFVIDDQFWFTVIFHEMKLIFVETVNFDRIIISLFKE